jgi:hypothetical protein
MSDLATKRNSRDLWISKGHVGAVAVLCLSMTVGGYALGYMMGESSGVSDVKPNNGLNPADTSVVELLDRIEGSRIDPANQQTLTFPSVLSGDGEQRGATHSAPKEPVNASLVAAGQVKGPVIHIKNIRRGEIALQMALKQMSKRKLVGREVGETFQSLTIAGFVTLEEAQQHLEGIQQQYPDLEAIFEIRGQ